MTNPTLWRDHISSPPPPSPYLPHLHPHTHSHPTIPGRSTWHDTLPLGSSWLDQYHLLIGQHIMTLNPRLYWTLWDHCKMSPSEGTPCPLTVLHLMTLIPVSPSGQTTYLDILLQDCIWLCDNEIHPMLIKAAYHNTLSQSYTSLGDTSTTATHWKDNISWHFVPRLYMI